MKTFKNGRKPQKSEKSHFLLHNVLTSTKPRLCNVYTYCRAGGASNRFQTAVVHSSGHLRQRICSRGFRENKAEFKHYIGLWKCGHCGLGCRVYRLAMAKPDCLKHFKALGGKLSYYLGHFVLNLLFESNFVHQKAEPEAYQVGEIMGYLVSQSFLLRSLLLQ